MVIGEYCKKKKKKKIINLIVLKILRFDEFSYLHLYYTESGVAGIMGFLVKPELKF